MDMAAALPGGSYLNVGRVQLSDIEAKTKQVTDTLWQENPPQDLVDYYSKDQNPGLSAYKMNQSLKSVKSRFKSGDKDAAVMIEQLDKKLELARKVGRGVGIAMIAGAVGLCGVMLAHVAGIDTASIGPFLQANTGQVTGLMSMAGGLFTAGIKMATQGLKKDRTFLSRSLQHIVAERANQQLLQGRAEIAQNSKAAEG